MAVDGCARELSAPLQEGFSVLRPGSGNTELSLSGEPISGESAVIDRWARGRTSTGEGRAPRGSGCTSAAGRFPGPAIELWKAEQEGVPGTGLLKRAQLCVAALGRRAGRQEAGRKAEW